MAQPRLNRPISPHLSAYNMLRPTSLLSILNRITGGGIAFGLMIMIVWLGAAAYGQECYDAVLPFLTHWLAWLIYLGVSGALFYHFHNGIRHMVWDLGHGFEMPVVLASGAVMVACAAATFGGFWLLVWALY